MREKYLASLKSGDEIRLKSGEQRIYIYRAGEFFLAGHKPFSFRGAHVYIYPINQIVTPETPKAKPGQLYIKKGDGYRRLRAWGTKDGKLATGFCHPFGDPLQDFDPAIWEETEPWQEK